MSEARWRIIFVNPHSHHAYFTCLALSRLGPVQILCPPLLLQLWLGQWKREGLRVGGSFLGMVVATPLALMAFLLYRLKLLSEASYCQGLGLAAGLLARSDERSLLYVYQDYLLPLLKSNSTHPVVMEMINRLASPAQANYASSTEALQLATLILAPCKEILADLSDQSTNVGSVPYGGNKLAYRRQTVIPREEHTAAFPNATRVLNIVARAFSYMKGIDILLGALSLLRQETFSSSIAIRVKICGPMAGRVYQTQIKSLTKFSTGFQLQIIAGQLSQDSYLISLQQADLFVMPSRLESMSLAALEALWMGVPAVLSPQCGVDHFKAGAHGRLIEPNTPETLAGILADILSHPHQLIEWRQQLVKDRALYSWDSYFEGVGKGVARFVAQEL